jgi:hypothetical protein
MVTSGRHGGEFLAPFDATVPLPSPRRPLHIQRNRARTLPWKRHRSACAHAVRNEESLKVYFKSRAALRELLRHPGPAAWRERPSAAKLKALMGSARASSRTSSIAWARRSAPSPCWSEFASRVVANVYCSFKGVQAFQTHFDLHDGRGADEGEKTWRIYERADAPVNPVPPGDEWEVAHRYARRACSRRTCDRAMSSTCRAASTTMR